MRIAIVGAMESEITYLRTKMDEEGIVSSNVLNNFRFYYGKILNHEIILVKSGIGRVASALLMQTLATNFRGIDKIINVGVAGGYNKNTDLNIGDIVIGESCVYGDVDIRVAADDPNTRYGQMSGCPLCFKGDNYIIDKLNESNLKYNLGTIVSCDKFTTSMEDSFNLVNNYFNDLNVLAFDMESASFGQVAYVYGLSFISIRAISDIIGGSEQASEYANCFEEASVRSNEFLMNLLDIL